MRRCYEFKGDVAVIVGAKGAIVEGEMVTEHKPPKKRFGWRQKRCDYCRMVERRAGISVTIDGYPMIYCPVCKRKLCPKKD